MVRLTSSSQADVASYLDIEFSGRDVAVTLRSEGREQSCVFAASYERLLELLDFCASCLFVSRLEDRLAVEVETMVTDLASGEIRRYFNKIDTPLSVSVGPISFELFFKPKAFDECPVEVVIWTDRNVVGSVSTTQANLRQFAETLQPETSEAERRLDSDRSAEDT